MYSLRDGGQITETIKNAFKYNIIKCYLEVLPENSNGTSTYIHHNNYLKSIDFDDCRYNQEEGIIGTTIAKGLSGDFVNVDSNFNIENREIKLFIGACLNDDLAEDEGKTDIQIINDSNVKYLKMGTFIIQKPENDNVNDNTRFEALDYMIKFNIPFVDRLNYDDPQNPITIGVLLQDICNQAGVTLGTTTFRNSTFVLENNQFTSGETCRDVLKAIAQMAFSWARINENDELVLDFNINSSQGEEIDYNEYYDLKFNNAYGPVNTIVLKDSQIEGENYTIHSSDYIEGTTKPVEIVIEDNPFAYTQDKRQALIEAGRSLFGFTYDPITINTIGAIYLNCLDKIKPKNMQNAYYSSYIFDTTISYNGKISDEKETKALTEVETKYKFTGDTTKIIRKTQIMVDKANQEITARVETIETESIPNLQAQIDGAIQFWNGSAIPTLNNYPANEWTTEAERNNHRADIYTVIQDVQGELKQGKSYRFDKVGNTWQWLELTDNELSAVQALANSKAKVFYTTPTVPYNLGDLWLKDGKLYRCKTAKGASGSYSANDWEEAVEYTDDTVALLAQSAADAAQDTADGAVTAINNIKDTTGSAEGKYIYLDDSSDNTLISAKFNGETSQATRESSRNVFNKNAEINKSMNAASKSVLNTGARIIADSGRAYNASVSVVMKLGNTTDLVGKTIRVKTTATPSANNLIPSLGIAIYSNDYSSATGLRKVSLNAGETGTLELTYTVSQNNNPNVGIVLYLTDSSTTSAGNYTDFENLMVTIDDEDMTYEPYGAMPSPDYPSEIENLEGKNLFNENQLLEATGWTKNAEGYYTGTSGNLYAKFKLDAGGFHFAKSFKENTRYTLSWTAYTSSGTGNPRFRIYYTNNTYQECTNWNYTTPTTMYTVSAANKTISKIIYTYGDNPGTIYIKDIQLEEGTVATPYVPYNSLEVKVIGKNLLDKNKEALGSNVTKTVLDTGVRVTTKVAGNARYCGIEIGKDELLGKKVTISANITVSGTNNASARLFFGKYNTPSTSGIGTALTSTGSNTITIPNSFYTGTDRIYLLLYSNVNGDTSIDNYVDYTNLQVEIGEEATEYEEYKEQIVYFPLAEGQKLYEESYPADDGIHNVRGQVVFDGSSDENWIKGSYPITGTVQMQIQKPANFFTETGVTAVAKLNCSHFKSENQVVNGMALGGMFNVYPSTDLSITTAAEFKTWLSNNPMTLEYPLAEEEIIPYNTEQQAAWEQIEQLHTYKNITNIYSDAYAEIEYVKDNGLDIYETKASANVTKNDVAQLKIENGRISSEVSSTQSQLNNYYTKNEADNNTNSTKAELQNIIQQNKTEVEQTTQEIALRVSSIETNGVDKIETSMGYTFNNEGLNIDKEGAATASTIDNEAFKVKNKSANENVFFAGYVSDQDSAYRGQTIVESTNLVVKNYLNIEGASRFQPYVNPVLGGHGTGAFDIG